MNKNTIARFTAFFALIGGGYYLGYSPNASMPGVIIHPADPAYIRHYPIVDGQGRHKMITEFWLPATVIKRNQFEDETFEEARARLMEIGKEDLEEHLYSTGQSAH